jgi:hypothetical protein
VSIALQSRMSRSQAQHKAWPTTATPLVCRNYHSVHYLGPTVALLIIDMRTNRSRSVCIAEVGWERGPREGAAHKCVCLGASMSTESGGKTSKAVIQSVLWDRVQYLRRPVSTPGGLSGAEARGAGTPCLRAAPRRGLGSPCGLAQRRLRWGMRIGIRRRWTGGSLQARLRAPVDPHLSACRFQPWRWCSGDLKRPSTASTACSPAPRKRVGCGRSASSLCCVADP